MNKNRKDFSGSSRRQYPRLSPSAVPFLKSVALSQGTEARVLNISRGGVLLETEVRLRPQMKILLKLVTSDGMIKLEGRILRSSISSLQGAPRYQSAIAFDHPFHMLDDLSAETEERIKECPSETADPSTLSDRVDEMLMPPVSDHALEEDSAVLTVITQDGISLQEMFKLNDW